MPDAILEQADQDLLEKLHLVQGHYLSKHASIPFNPDVASVFFRAGMIESWGRGIERLLEACQEARTPAPKLRYEHTALWVEFRFLPEHTVSATLKITGEVAGEATGEVEWACPDSVDGF